jgi:integrase
MASICKIDGVWRALIRRKGHKPISKRFPTKAEAAAWARDLEGQIDQGRAVKVLSIATVADLIQAYRDLRAGSRPILDTSNEHYTLKILSEYLGKIRCSALSTDDLVGYAQKRKDEGAGPYTVNMDISKLGTVIRYSGDGMADVVGAARPKLNYLGLIGGGGKRNRRPEQDELDRILDLLTGQVADAVRFAVLTAMRRGEICRLLWTDLDEKKRTVIIRDRKDPRKKAGNDQVVPLLGEAWPLALAQPRSNERIFPLHPQTLSKTFKAACDALAIPDLHFHDLRHEGVSRMFEAGYVIQQVAVVSGHKSWNQLKRYTQIKPESLHDHGKP